MMDDVDNAIISWYQILSIHLANKSREKLHSVNGNGLSEYTKLDLASWPTSVC